MIRQTFYGVIKCPPCSLTPTLAGSSVLFFHQELRSSGDIWYISPHVSFLTTADFVLHNTGTIRQYFLIRMPTDAFVLSNLVYCGSLLPCLLLYRNSKLPKLQNFAAWLMFKVPKQDHTKHLFRILHWLPVQARIEHKLATPWFRFCAGNALFTFS